MGELVRLVVSDPVSDLDHVARRLRECRVSRGFSCDILGDKIGVAGSYIDALETGKARPSLALLSVLVAHLGYRLKDVCP